MLPLFPQRADITEFDFPVPSVITGADLRGVQRLADSIAELGLLAPIVVARDPHTEQLRVVDGIKRLVAIRRLAFAGRLPRSLNTVPYIVAEDLIEASPLTLLSPIEQVEQVEELTAGGMSVGDIAAKLYASEGLVRDLQGIAKLSDRLRNAFFGGHICLDQARAFATLPNPDSQDALLLALGPFAEAPEILRAIADGQTVVSFGADEDDVLILPSRAAA